MEAFIKVARNAEIDLEADLLPSLEHGFMSLLSAAPDRAERARLNGPRSERHFRGRAISTPSIRPSGWPPGKER